MNKEIDHSHLTPKQIANMILSRHRAGTFNYPPEVIIIALAVTGDLND